MVSLFLVRTCSFLSLFWEIEDGRSSGDESFETVASMILSSWLSGISPMLVGMVASMTDGFVCCSTMVGSVGVKGVKCADLLDVPKRSVSVLPNPFVFLIDSGRILTVSKFG